MTDTKKTPPLHGGLEATLSDSLREFLEHKHLYQRQALEDPLKYAYVRILSESGAPDTPESQAEWRRILALPWHLEGELEREAPYGPGLNERGRMLFVRLPRVKLFCTTCGRTEPFAPLRGLDLVTQSYVPATRPAFTGEQLYAITYLCQSCHKLPEAFLLRRNALRLTLEGRGPIEHVDVPAFIPKDFRSYFSGATVAFQSGQVLAGLFLLRTLIEQFARSLVPTAPPNADVLMQGYQDLLPADFKSRFPSLPDMYSQISAALHAAKPDTGLFGAMRKGMVEHFEARRLFKLDASTT